MFHQLPASKTEVDQWWWKYSVTMNEYEEEEGSWEEVKWPLRSRVIDTTGKPSSIEVKRRTWEIILIPTETTTTTMIESNKKKKKKREKEERKKLLEEKLKRQWDVLPNTALLNIFCKSGLKDRLKSIPLVCKSWKSVTDDPRCWSSMISDSISPEVAFIKRRYDQDPFPRYGYPCHHYRKLDYNHLIGISRLFKEEGDDDEIEEEEEEEVPAGVSRLRTLIKKSGGGAAITSLYLSPFTPSSFSWYDDDKSWNEIFHLIANCCPNLKHIAFDEEFFFSPTYMKALLQLFNR